MAGSSTARCINSGLAKWASPRNTMRVQGQTARRRLTTRVTIMAFSAPVGLALAAPLGEWIGVRGVFLFAGSLGALASLVGFLSPSLLALQSPPARGIEGAA